MKIRNVAILTTVLILAVFIGSSAVLAQGGCEVPGDLRVIVTEAKWEFDLKTGRLSGEATVRNICDSDVIAPGISVGIFGIEGQMVNNVAQRGTEPRLAPGKSVKVKFHIDLKEAPASLMFMPFEGMVST
ncbi:MAG TPA: hypothetical protein PLS21_06465 [Synergistales bacterium]|nr:hypothetical protein [Synergistaceae bacterium]HPA58983.1 hypothetical protein [Synergistales bacterium]HQO83619.1 hypothetical protein [Synergistales bacterium]HQQ10222.1 hypothetical protein [Synergistales bacterium]